MGPKPWPRLLFIYKALGTWFPLYMQCCGRPLKEEDKSVWVPQSKDSPRDFSDCMLPHPQNTPHAHNAQAVPHPSAGGKGCHSWVCVPGDSNAISGSCGIGVLRGNKAESDLVTCKLESHRADGRAGNSRRSPCHGLESKAHTETQFLPLQGLLSFL